MNFNETLNNYIKLLKCSSKELSNASSLSMTVISRYRNGKRLPNYNSEQLIKLADGLYFLATNKKNLTITKKKILDDLNNSLNFNSFDYEQFSKNFNELISILKINITDISKYLNFDASYVSRIRTGQRKPSDPKVFANDVSSYILRKFTSAEKKLTIANLINYDLSKIEHTQTFLTSLSNWLYNGITKKNDNIDTFLKRLDEFDLNEYIRTIHFNEIKVPTIPFKLPTSKNYYGIKEMRTGELDFFKATVLSKNMDSIFMYSDMPMEDMAEDIDFSKKWMFAIAMALKKGLHLNIIHNLDRPFNELMLGLESWIPIYMTGQVSPYYFKKEQNSIYCHLDYVSGSATLYGECIKGFHNKTKYHLSNSKEDISYYKEKAKNLLDLANPLIQIYNANSLNSFKSFILSDSKICGTRHRILSSLPIFTISDKLLLQILNDNCLKENEINEIFSFVKDQKERYNTILNHSSIIDDITKLSEDEFNKYPVFLSLSEIFYEKKITYSYKNYLKHFNLTKEYANKTKNYFIRIIKNNAFRNIQISILPDKYIVISKDNSPSIQFIIKHTKLCEAIENFIAPIID